MTRYDDATLFDSPNDFPDRYWEDGGQHEHEPDFEYLCGWLKAKGVIKHDAASKPAVEEPVNQGHMRRCVKRTRDELKVTLRGSQSAGE